jgi:molecular chaperone GrpE
LAKAQRALADYANLKKRFEREREEISQYASEMLLLQFLPAIDNLDRAVFYANDEEQKSALYTGVKMTLQQIHELLGSIGFEQISAKEGDHFDPHSHEAVEMVAGKQSTIVALVQPGYKLKDKVVRPAQVKVGNGETVN